jgi:hypothetical protein
MDINMEDVGRVPEPSKLSPATEPASISTLDGWIERLMKCQQLAEVDVQRLCEKVCLAHQNGGIIWRSLKANKSVPGKRSFAGGIQCPTSSKFYFAVS